MRIEPWMVLGGYRMAHVWWERTEDGHDQCHEWVAGEDTVYATEAECLAAIRRYERVAA